MMLTEFGVHTVADIVTHRGELATVFSAISFEFFMHAAVGISSGYSSERSDADGGRKGISCERTFSVVSSKEDLQLKARELSEKLSVDMAAESLAGKCVTLKLKTDAFQVRCRLSRSVTTLPSTCTGAWLHPCTARLKMYDVIGCVQLVLHDVCSPSRRTDRQLVHVWQTTPEQCLEYCPCTVPEHFRLWASRAVCRYPNFTSAALNMWRCVCRSGSAASLCPATSPQEPQSTRPRASCC